MKNNLNAHISLFDPRYNYGYKGFCSIVTNIIDIALEHYIEFNNFNCIIEDAQVLKLFDQINNLEKSNFYNAGSVYMDRLLSNTLLSGKTYNAHTLANLENLKLRNFTFNSILKIKSEYENKFNDKVKQFNLTNNTLGLHIRGTDKAKELPKLDNNKVLSIIENCLKQYNIDKIFLSTDDANYLNFLKKRFGDFLIYDETNIISKNNEPIHFSNNREKINEEVLSSVYILSRCRKLIYCFSNVGFLSLIMGAQNLEFIDNLN